MDEETTKMEMGIKCIVDGWEVKKRSNNGRCMILPFVERKGDMNNS